jgi:hypothetical protein
MDKRPVVFGIVVLLALTGLGGCRNFFHELIPPDENRIRSFSVPGQIGQARIGDTTVHVTVGPGVDTAALLPSIAVSPKATLVPVTIPYIRKAFPSVDLFGEAFDFYASQDKTGYVIDLIKRNPDFTVPALTEAIDFTGPVTFLVVSGLGTIRQYTVNVEVDTGEGKILSFGFTKFDNPELTRGDAVGTVNEETKTITAEVWYPVENIASFKLIPNFQTNGAAVSLEEGELTSGVTEIDFTSKPDSGGWSTKTRTKTLTVQRPGFEPETYTLTVTFKEDPDTVRSLVDFRFTEALNYGIRYTVMGEITNTGDTGTVTVRVHYAGAIPAVLSPSFVSPGTVSVAGSPQTSGVDSQDFSRDVSYRVVSRDGNYIRDYRIQVLFVNEADARPRIESFFFDAGVNPGLEAGTMAMIDHNAGLIVIEALYSPGSPPYTLKPGFSAGGIVSAGGVTQTGGVSVQDFSRRVKYTVRDPGNPNLYRDYWAEVRFVQNSRSLAEISLFRFETADNPGLCADVTAVIDQAAGTITAELAFSGIPPGGNGGHRTLVPRWMGRGTVWVGNAVQTSGVSGRVLAPQAVYRVVSEDGVFSKDYTVRVTEVNSRIYVDADAGGDNTGVSWANAFRSLQDACAAAGKLPPALAAELWIAEGTYRPSETGDTDAYFQVSPNTGYYGGFAGTETAKTQRIPGAHPVTITGDLGGGVYAEHLFMSADLGGRNAAFGEMKFTKTRAFTGMGRNGPAVYVSGANNVTITNGVFEDLQANGNGGAVNASTSSGGSVNIRDCEFKETQTLGAYNAGGAVSVSASPGSSVSISGCEFKNTQAGSSGGAVYAYSPDGFIGIMDCTFEDTRSGGNGGAVSVSAAGSVNISGCKFKKTLAENDGGAVSAVPGTGGSTSISGCEFKETQAGNEGGAVSVVSSSGGSVNISDCDFENTQAKFGGAVLAVPYSSVNITGCFFTGTRAEYHGGAICAFAFNVTSSSVSISNCDFENTQAGEAGGAISSINVFSCVLSGLSFAACAAPQGSILSGDRTLSTYAAVAYTVRPGCSVDSVPVTAGMIPDLPSTVVYLAGGSTITWAP